MLNFTRDGGVCATLQTPISSKNGSDILMRPLYTAFSAKDDCTPESQALALSRLALAALRGDDD